MRLNKLKRALRGEVKLTTAAREVIRRSRVAAQARRERATLDHQPPLSLTSPFSQLNPSELLSHFQKKRKIGFFPGLNWCPPGVTASELEWRKDPRSNYVWPLDYHRDLKLQRTDGSDIRIVWELNRLGHLLQLTDANQFLHQLQTWQDQNPYGRGPNWSCAMEVALRAINILAAFENIRQSPALDPDALYFILRLLQQHGTYIENNLEFSHISTSNHYLSDVAGLLWLGVMLPELRDARQWGELGLTELLHEMDKQIQADGSDYEASTGYHRFVTELFLYAFMLCREHKVEIEQKYWRKLHQMLVYIKAYVRPDGFAPLIGDTDGGQVLPFQQHRADDHAYVLDVGAELFNDPSLKFPEQSSKAFPDAGSYIMRSDDCYLCFNASGAGINGRGSHGHNDALSIELSARGRAFIVDPGTYVYTGDLKMRHAFRSTAYHSTVKIDGQEQNTTDLNTPFVIGNEAQPRVLEWQSNAEYDKVVAEHYGYRRLPVSVAHRRTVTFNKKECWWLIEDEFFGEGEHEFETWFHFNDGLQLELRGGEIEATDKKHHHGLIVRSLTLSEPPELVQQHCSRDYGELIDSVSACWRVSGRVSKLSWKLFLT
ncbi:MAG: heparinase II/III family protein [Acidobacteria bacterium]|nr:heparinase II/III family protein [Acidobacteriota bacterium]MCA1627884.1 heparinase II/III family protein [Acidobacteriota bacterium]